MLGEISRRNARFKPNELAIIFEDRVVTHGQFAERAFRLVNAMQKRGVRPGDRVAVLAQNCIEFMEAYAAGELGGWTTVTINYRLAEPEIAYILSDSKPSVLIAEAQFHDRLGPQTLALTDHVLTIGGSNTYAQALDAAEPRVPDVTVPPEETAFLMYTSGTTGRPKGVMLSHGGQMQAAFMSALDFNVQPMDRLALAMPLYHIGAKNLWLSHSLFGCTIILQRAFRPASFLQSIRDHKATRTLLAPTMLSDLLDTGEFTRASIPSLQRILYSAAPMPEALLRRGLDAFGTIFAQVYGLTESGGPGCSLHPHQHVLDGPPRVVRHLRSAGQPMVGCRVRIVRSDGSDCADMEPGEIVIRSDAIMTGYWNNHDATLNAIRGGWLYTGDIGECDEGFVFVVDRAKDLIVSGGENIYSREVENALMDHPSVLEAAVVGAPDERWGEVVAAFVVLRNELTLTADEVIAHCRENIASYKRPRIVRFIDALPKLPNGKVEKYKLRGPLWAGQGRTV